MCPTAKMIALANEFAMFKLDDRALHGETAKAYGVTLFPNSQDQLNVSKLQNQE